MPLAMARPWKHPDTGIYWLRRRVPEALRPLVGKREIRQTLATRDISEAKQRHAEALAKLERQWANLRRGAGSLTDGEAHALAAPFETRFVAEHAAYPRRPTIWDATLGPDLWRLDPTPSLSTVADSQAFLSQHDPTLSRRLAMQAWCLEQADHVLEAEGRRVDEAGRRLLAEAVALATQRGAETLRRYARGEYGAPAAPVSGPSPLSSQRPGLRTGGAVGFRSLAEGWIRERQPAQKTRYTFPRVLDELAAFLGHDDAARVTGEDLVRWKEALLAQGLAGSTIRNGKLGPIRTVLQWAVDNKRLPLNPATRIGVSTKAKVSEGKIPFSDAEASIILGAAAAETDPVYRWVPWLCAYTGARVAEICQLRREDVVERDGISCLCVTHEAGSLKTRSSERVIPLHPAVIEAGFLAFVSSVRPGPLFPGLTPDRFGSRGGNGSKLLGRWVRSLGIDNPRLQPNHAWRHRLKTLFRRHAIAGDLGRAILGHAAADVSDAYGDTEVPALYREILKLPSVIVAPPPESKPSRAGRQSPLPRTRQRLTRRAAPAPRTAPMPRGRRT
jgi:integrase